ncbi:hypothetical protein ES288_A13G178800v1 [Gossypium darwinii]|uniref:Uncharacterized protein n=1 Tax=Gossypium darwinii TaxID=34276 RepID=A0A5D2E128_GOSDA|nr:hypothetical protein ES288_A13G178800v1 [Gossypium darwinii]
MMLNGRGSQPPISGLIWATEKNPPTARPRGSGAQKGQWRRIFWLFAVLARGGQASDAERAGEARGERRKAARVLNPFSFAENV